MHFRWKSCANNHGHFSHLRNWLILGVSAELLLIKHNTSFSTYVQLASSTSEFRIKAIGDFILPPMQKNILGWTVNFNKPIALLGINNVSLCNKVCSLVRFLLAAVYLPSKCGTQLNPFIPSLKIVCKKTQDFLGRGKVVNMWHKHATWNHVFPKQVYFARVPCILLRASEHFFQHQFSLSAALLDKQILFPLLKRLGKKGKKVTPQGDIGTFLQSQE